MTQLKLYEQSADHGKTFTQQWLTEDDIKRDFHNGILTREIGSDFWIIVDGLEEVER